MTKADRWAAVEDSLFTTEEYLQVLELSYEVANSLRGKICLDGRLPDCQDLALKLYVHGASIYWLSLGTQAPVPKSTNGSSFIDFASAAVVARAAFDTYLTLFEVFLAPQSDDEFEFNYCLWHLAGRVVQEGVVPLDASLLNDYTAAQEDLADIRSRIEKTAKFAMLSRKQKRSVLQGVRTRAWKELAEAAGFGLEFVRRMYRYYSSYVHSDGLSANQIMDARSKGDQVFHMRIHLLTALIVISKMIVGYEARFPEAAQVCKDNPSASDRAHFWSDTVANIR